MNKLKKILAVLSLTGMIAPTALAQSGFTNRLPDFVKRGRVLVTELSEQQQNAFGLESAREALTSIIDSGNSNRVRRLAGTIAAAELGVSLDQDLNRARFRVIRNGQRPSVRRTAVLSSAEQQFGSEFTDRFVAIIEEIRSSVPAPEPEPPVVETPPVDDGPAAPVGVVLGRDFREVAAETGLTIRIISVLSSIERNGEVPAFIRSLNILLDAQSPEERAQSVATIQSLFPDLNF